MSLLDLVLVILRQVWNALESANGSGGGGGGGSSFKDYAQPVGLVTAAAISIAGLLYTTRRNLLQQAETLRQTLASQEEGTVRQLDAQAKANRELISEQRRSQLKLVDAQMTIATRNLQGERVRARDDRNFARKSELYVELLEIFDRLLDSIRIVNADRDPEQPLEAKKEIKALKPRWLAYASNDVRLELEKFQNYLQSYYTQFVQARDQADTEFPLSNMPVDTPDEVRAYNDGIRQYDEYIVDAVHEVSGSVEDCADACIEAIRTDLDVH